MNDNIGFIVDVKCYAVKSNFDKSLHGGDSNCMPTNQKYFDIYRFQIADGSGHFELIQSAGHWYCIWLKSMNKIRHIYCGC